MNSQMIFGWAQSHTTKTLTVLSDVILIQSNFLIIILFILMNKVGCATYSKDACKTLRLPDGSSIFTAEAKAIDLALDFINNCNSYNKFSDSLSVLQALYHTMSKNQQIQNILLKHHSISEFKTVVY